jgi:hypothetical protein
MATTASVRGSPEQRQLNIPPKSRECDCGCGRMVGRGRRRFADDNCRRTARRKERIREPDEYMLAMLRMLRKVNVQRGFDADAFADLVALDGDMHVLMREVAASLVAQGYSWADIGRACGMSRQGARQRWGR